jgi:hypothetical protein
MNNQKKYRITRATLHYEGGKKDIIQSSIFTDDIEDERKRLKAEFNCEKVSFRIYDYSSKSRYTVKHGND